VLAVASSPCAKQPKAKSGYTGANDMKKEYDFSKAERGKFYRRGVRLNLPVYLDPEVQARLTKAAQKRRENVSALVNHRNNCRGVESCKRKREVAIDGFSPMIAAGHVCVIRRLRFIARSALDCGGPPPLFIPHRRTLRGAAFTPLHLTHSDTHRNLPAPSPISR
jgi:hypothetical protein